MSKTVTDTSPRLVATPHQHWPASCLGSAPLQLVTLHIYVVVPVTFTFIVQENIQFEQEHVNSGLNTRTFGTAREAFCLFVCFFQMGSGGVEHRIYGLRVIKQQCFCNILHLENSAMTPQDLISEVMQIQTGGVSPPIQPYCLCFLP